MPVDNQWWSNGYTHRRKAVTAARHEWMNDLWKQPILRDLVTQYDIRHHWHYTSKSIQRQFSMIEIIKKCKCLVLLSYQCRIHNSELGPSSSSFLVPIFWVDLAESKWRVVRSSSRFRHRTRTVKSHNTEYFLTEEWMLLAVKKECRIPTYWKGFFGRQFKISRLVRILPEKPKCRDYFLSCFHSVAYQCNLQLHQARY